MEASDLMEIGHITYDQALKQKMTQSRSKYCTGPFFQLVSYQFGTFKILVRYEVDAGDFAALKAYVFFLKFVQVLLKQVLCLELFLYRYINK